MNALQPEAGGASCADVLVWPAQAGKLAPCGQGCASGSDVRQWIGLVAQRAKLSLSNEQAYTRAWRLLVDATLAEEVVQEVY